MKRQELPEAFTLFTDTVGKVSREAKRIYTDALVLWLGVYQELQLTSCRGSLEELFTTRGRELMGECARKETGKVSDNVGALIQARQNISMERLQMSLYALYSDIKGKHLWKGYRVIGLDGSTVTLNRSTPELCKAFPGCPDNKKKKVSRWPTMLMVLMIDLLEGTVMSANLGPKFGKKATSEQVLSQPLFSLLENKSIVVGDRNFGTFDIANRLVDNGVKMLLRLNVSVAKMLAGENKLCDGLNKKISWQCTAEMSEKYGYEPNSEIHGRLIVKQITHNGKSFLVYFFTTFDCATATELAELYRKRWNFEEDLKSIKIQLRLKDMQAEKKSSVEVEFYCKLLAFNITRGLILIAVKDTDIDPRRISFSLAFLIVRTRLPEYAAQPTNSAKEEILDQILARIRRAIIPYRPNRSYPRVSYGRRPTRYPMKSSAIPKN